MILKPQPGQQYKFLASPADIVFYGGSAGGGKSYGLLLDVARYHRIPHFGAVIFRRTFPEIVNQGGLWDESETVIAPTGATPNKGRSWAWKRFGTKLRFSHLQHMKDVHKWQGSQLPFIGLDEGTHFPEAMFWYLLSRNRSAKCKLRPCMRITVNPDPECWIRPFIDWWIGDDGLPIEERDGVLRWFIRDRDTVVWADTIDELPPKLAYNKKGVCLAKSVTFIRSRLEDNPILMDNDPQYEANLNALPAYERALLKDGNWNVTRGGGMRFKREWFQIIDEEDMPFMEGGVRYWDRASTAEVPKGATKKADHDSDYTAGVKLERDAEGVAYVTDVCEGRWSPKQVLDTIRNVATQDASPDDISLWLEEDPGQAGVAEAHYLLENLAAYSPKFIHPSGSKWVRSGPVSAACEQGLVKLKRGKWNERFIAQCVAFVDEHYVSTGPQYHDDMVDAFSGAYSRLPNLKGPSIT